MEWQVRVEDMKGLFSVTWLIYICFLPVHLCFSPSLLSGSVLASEWISNPQNQADDPKARAKKAEEEAKRREELLKKKASKEELEIRRQRNDQVSLQHSILFPTLRNSRRAYPCSNTKKGRHIYNPENTWKHKYEDIC